MSLFKLGARGSHFFFLIFFLLGFNHPPAEALGQTQRVDSEDTQKDKSRFVSPHILIELSGGWYSVSDSRYIEVYSKGNGMLTFAVHPIFGSLGRHSFGLAAGIKSFSIEGESTVTLTETRLILTPLYLGGEYSLDLRPFFPGFEIGVGHCLYTEQSLLVTTKGSTTGYHVQGHLVFQPPGLSFLRAKLYIRHSRFPAEEAVRVNLGGLEYGAGLLIKLNLSRTNRKNR